MVLAQLILRRQRQCQLIARRGQQLSLMAHVCRHLQALAQHLAIPHQQQAMGLLLAIPHRQQVMVRLHLHQLIAQLAQQLKLTEPVCKADQALHLWEVASSFTQATPQHLRIQHRLMVTHRTASMRRLITCQFANKNIKCVKTRPALSRRVFLWKRFKSDSACVKAKSLIMGHNA
jgi:hypothetical protein